MSEEEERVKWLRMMVSDPLGGPWWVPHNHLSTFLSAIDARDVEIERLRAQVQSVTDAATEREMALCFRLDKMEHRPTPSLAEVAIRVAVGMLMNPVNDTVSIEHFVRSVCDVAEALLAELERRGK